MNVFTKKLSFITTIVNDVKYEIVSMIKDIYRF